MNTSRVLAVAALMLTGMATANAADVAPAWRSPGFVMEEIVVTAEAPASYYMEEIVVTARLEDIPARLAMRTRFLRNMRNVLHF
jgi:hypothetical protein